MEEKTKTISDTENEKYISTHIYNFLLLKLIYNMWQKFRKIKIHEISTLKKCKDFFSLLVFHFFCLFNRMEAPGDWIELIFLERNTLLGSINTLLLSILAFNVEKFFGLFLLDCGWNLILNVGKLTVRNFRIEGSWIKLF